MSVFDNADFDTVLAGVSEKVFVKRDKKVKGPFDMAFLLDIAKQGKLLPSDEIGPTDNGPWELVSSNEELTLAIQSKSAKRKKSLKVKDYKVITKRAAEGIYEIEYTCAKCYDVITISENEAKSSFRCPGCNIRSKVVPEALQEISSHRNAIIEAEKAEQESTDSFSEDIIEDKDFANQDFNVVPSGHAGRKKSNSTLFLMASGAGGVVVLVAILGLLLTSNTKPTPEVNDQQVVALEPVRNDPVRNDPVAAKAKVPAVAPVPMDNKHQGPVEKNNVHEDQGRKKVLVMDDKPEEAKKVVQADDPEPAKIPKGLPSWYTTRIRDLYFKDYSQGRPKCEEVTLRELEVFPENYIGKFIRISTFFNDINQSVMDSFHPNGDEFVSSLNLQVGGEGNITKAQIIDSEKRQSIGFSIGHYETEYFYNVIAGKKAWAELVLSLKKFEPINIEGYFHSFDDFGRTNYGILTIYIERASQ